jgi:1-aminocyclopropane-1-carboxylate deaminase/D-cysteine desulfhydrase-like pyridoxal-dependent ACC family enzyme
MSGIITLSDGAGTTISNGSIQSNNITGTSITGNTSVFHNSVSIIGNTPALSTSSGTLVGAE